MDDKQVQSSFLTANVYPVLAQKARMQTDKVSGKPMLLYPEGVVMLNETGATIVELCDGQRTFPEIVASLAQQYGTTPEMLRDDVNGYILQLYKHSLIELRTTENSR